MKDPTARTARCTVQLWDGSFCDSPSGEDLPFPICGRHASKLFIHMREMLREFNGDPMRRMMAAIDDLDTERARRAKVTPLPREGVVYYVLVGNLLKIGYSTNLALRLRAYPPNRKLLATEPGAYSLEARRHSEFKELLDSGREWFRFEGALVEHVRQLREQVA